MSSFITQRDASFGEISIPLKERVFRSKKKIARPNSIKIKGF
jgi:hypothetical protein